MFFPLLEKHAPGTMQSNVAQHHAFEKPLLAFEELLESMRTEATPYSADELCAAIDAFLPTLYAHLRDEIPTMRADVMRGYVTEAELMAIEKEGMKHVMAETSLVLGVPMVWINGDANRGAW